MLKKPYKTFPLTPRKDGRWVKQIKGKKYYFTGSAPEALDQYHSVCDQLSRGEDPLQDDDRMTVFDALNFFITAKKAQVESGVISERVAKDYVYTCKFVLKILGEDLFLEDLNNSHFRKLRADLDSRVGLVRVTGEVTRIRTFLRWCYTEGHVNEPIRIGEALKKPPARVMRRVKRESGVQKMVTRDEFLGLTKSAAPPLKAMLFLGLNCGLGNTDCSSLHHSHLDLENGWLNYPRPKTEVDRKCFLWPETVDALRASIEFRTTQAETLVFITKFGSEWVSESKNSVALEFGKLAKKTGLKRPGLAFYSLRHTYATIASGSKDQIAVNHTMGHADNSMAAVYREFISDERIMSVSNFVREWLYEPRS